MNKAINPSKVTSCIVLNLAVAAFTLLSFSQAAIAQDNLAKNGQVTDRDAVQQACFNYIDAIYQCKPELIEQSIHPELVKLGFSTRNQTSEYQARTMSFEQLVKLAGSYNKEGRIPKDAPRAVDVYDVMDKTASAKVTASWGIDYMQLVKEEGQWKVRHILWQSHSKQVQNAISDNSLDDGIYLVHRWSEQKENLDQLLPGEVLIEHDPSALVDSNSDPVIHLTVSRQEGVTFENLESVNAVNQTDGRINLDVKLSDDAAKRLEAMSRKYLGRQVTIVINGKAITLHKVRSIIKDGNISISRCTDDGCRVILQRLKEK